MEEIKKNFEIVEFYPFATKNKKFLGTLHIYDIDKKIDIRGIRVLKQGAKYFFMIPFSQTIDVETGKMVTYPIISYQEEEKHLKLIAFLKKEGNEYIKKYLSENPDTLNKRSEQFRSLDKKKETKKTQRNPFQRVFQNVKPRKPHPFTVRSNPNKNRPPQAR